MPGWVVTANLLFSVAFMIFLYKFMPLVLATKLGKVYPMLTGRIPFNLVEGIIRVSILVAFLYAGVAFQATCGGFSSTTARSTKWFSISNPASR